MTFSANISLVLPELVLGVSALVLLVWGAFSKKTTPVFTGASVLALLKQLVPDAITAIENFHVRI